MKHCQAGLIAMLFLGTGVNAQPPIGSYTPPQVNPNPAFSPYLNLNRGNNPAINYFGVVRPQFENQQAIQQLQQQFQGTQGMMPGQGGPVATEDIGPTGHRMGGFFNYSHYYPLFSATGRRRRAGRGRSWLWWGRLWGPRWLWSGNIRYRIRPNWLWFYSLNNVGWNSTTAVNHGDQSQGGCLCFAALWAKSLPNLAWATFAFLLAHSVAFAQAACATCATGSGTSCPTGNCGTSPCLPFPLPAGPQMVRRRRAPHLLQMQLPQAHLLSGRGPQLGLLPEMLDPMAFPTRLVALPRASTGLYGVPRHDSSRPRDSSGGYRPQPARPRQ